MQEFAHKAAGAVGGDKRGGGESVDFPRRLVPDLDLDRGGVVLVTAHDLDQLVAEAGIDHAGAPDLTQHHRLDHVL